VGLAIVPEHNDVAPQVAEQVTQELADLGLLDVLAVKPAVQPQPAARGADGHGGNGRDPVVLVAVADDWRLAARPPGAANRRNQEIPGFVDKSDMGAQPRRVFFMRGQSLFFHASIAASSRCVARISGFWQVQFKSCRIRPTWSR
jgi:hypothetical protein